jgi:Kef-type K+ transport system membrane component KefB
VNFGALALIVLAGLAGPLLGVGRGAFVPVVIGEVLAGVIVGRTGLDAVDLTDPTVQFLSDVGFAMLMFTVGAHIPLRDPRLPASLRSGAVAAGAVCCSARSEAWSPRGPQAPGTLRSTR